MVTIWRVTYPLITRDGSRDFTSKEEANRFFYEMRNRTSPYLTMHSWRHVRMVAVDVPDVDERPDLEFSCDGGWGH